MISRPLWQNAVIEEGKPFTFEGLLRELWGIMEAIQAAEQDLATTGANITAQLATLRGYEFMDIVMDKVYKLQPREVVLEKETTGGWQDLIMLTGGIVLFADDFGELIRPVSDLDHLCQSLYTLPDGHNYLASSLSFLGTLFKGSIYSVCKGPRFRWHKHSLLFEPCSMPHVIKCECVRLQQIVNSGRKSTTPPGKVGEEGCVMFGQVKPTFRTNNPCS
jgi:hypothetical protein